MPALIAALSQKTIQLRVGRRVELNPPQNLDGEPNQIYVLRFKRSNSPLPDGFFHGAFTRIVLGKKIKNSQG